MLSDFTSYGDKLREKTGQRFLRPGQFYHEIFVKLIYFHFLQFYLVTDNSTVENMDEFGSESLRKYRSYTDSLCQIGAELTDDELKRLIQDGMKREKVMRKWTGQ